MPDAAAVPSSNRSSPWPRPAVAAAIGLAVLAVALRLVAARGELWFDEIWSLDLVARVHDVGGIFWGINHDNNHFLNSLWLWWLGPNAPPLVQRGAAIAAGLVTVAAAGRLGSRFGPGGALVAAGALALSFPEVQYASEARGYAGMLACLLLAVIALEAAIDGRPRLRLAIGFALAAAVGVSSHLFMAPALVVLGLWALDARIRDDRDLAAGLRWAVALFWPGALLVSGLVVGLALIRARFGFTAGWLDPFTLTGFVSGYGRLIVLGLGLPITTPPIAGLFAAGSIVAAVAVLARDRPDHRAALAVAVVVALPLLMAVARLPNADMARYYLPSLTVLLLAFADLLGLLWARAGAARVVALLLALGFVLGNGVSLARFFAEGRGDAAAIVARMGAEGPIVAGGDHDLRGRLQLLHHARRRGLAARWVDIADLCRDPPRFLIVETPDHWAERVRPVVAACPRALVPVMAVGAWGFSGTPWRLYRFGEPIAVAPTRLPAF